MFGESIYTYVPISQFRKIVVKTENTVHQTLMIDRSLSHYHHITMNANNLIIKSIFSKTVKQYGSKMYVRRNLRVSI